MMALDKGVVAGDDLRHLAEADIVSRNVFDAVFINNERLDDNVHTRLVYLSSCEVVYDNVLRTTSRTLRGKGATKIGAVAPPGLSPTPPLRG